MSLINRHNLEMIASVATSWIARLSAAIFTFVTLPLILKALGADGFAVYLYVINFPGWLVLAMLGAQSAPAYLLSRATRREGGLLFRARLGTALAAPLALTAGGALLATILVVSGWVGQGQASTPALLASLWLNALVVFGGVFENLALGLGRAYVFNLVRIAALALSLGGLFLAIATTRRVDAFVLLTIGPQALLLYVAGLALMRRSRTTPIFSLRLLRRHALSRLNRSIVSGFLLMSLPFVINVQFGPTLLGAFYGAADISSLLVLMRVLIFAAAFFGAITATSWPLLGQLRARGDHAALVRNTSRLIGGGSAVLVVGGLFTAFFGEFALRLWLPALELRQPGLMPVFALYLALYLWNTLWLAVLSALGQIAAAGRLSAIEAGIGLIAGMAFYRYDQSVGYLLGLIAGMLASTSLFAPLRALQALRATTGMSLPLVSRAPAT